MELGKINIGNVSFDKNDVKESMVQYKDGQKLNCVFLKNGTKITFKDQKADAHASVKTGSYAGGSEADAMKLGTGFFGITGLTIEGSNKDDYYHLTDCEDFDVDTRGGGSDTVRVFNHSDHKVLNSRIRNDSNDIVSAADDKEFMNMNEGFFIKRSD